MPRTAVHPEYRLAAQHRSDVLLTATAARFGAELGHKHHGQIPPEVVDATVARFGDLLRSACTVASAVPGRNDEDTENEGRCGGRGRASRSGPCDMGCRAKRAVRARD